MTPLILHERYGVTRHRCAMCADSFPTYAHADAHLATAHSGLVLARARARAALETAVHTAPIADVYTRTTSAPGDAQEAVSPAAVPS